MSPLAAIAIPAATAAATQFVQQVLAQRPFAQFFGPAPGEPSSAGVSLGDIGSQVGRRLEQLQTVIADRLAAAGIDPATDFEMSLDARGRLVVGEHPQRDAISAALAEDPSIRNTLAEISGMRGLLESAKRHLEFAKRYALDPLTALPSHHGDAPVILHFADGLVT